MNVVPGNRLSLNCGLIAMIVGSIATLTTIEAQAVDWPTPTYQPGPFNPTMESLKQYKCPEWFRDAKFGIWAHWGPQAVPMDGDWYARGMYEPGNGHYAHHTANYGHPSTNGYKDIIPLWKAEKWEPDRLMALYKKAGARYFVSMGSHHDNFELWNDPLHRWNAVNMGPKRDVVGEWQKAAEKYGLRFGVSEHLGASFTWFQSAHGADKTGPMAGVSYDGADSQYWDLYHQPADPDDHGWYSTNPVWQKEWFWRIRNLIDNYHPDLLYSDGGLPFGNEVGRTMVTHLYNTNIKKHGDLEVVYNCKQKSEGRWVEDLERGVMPGINPDPWQTDTSIGDWFYNKNWKFRPVSWVITMLADIVSKNGNLLLNVVQRPDGSLDPEVEQMLQEISDWNAVNGEAIFGTRPWLVYGEGAVKTKGGSFKEDFNYSSKDVRFTTKGKTLYAIVLGWPESGEVTIRALATSANGNRITHVSMLGLGTQAPSSQKGAQRTLAKSNNLEWTQTPAGLTVKFPATKPCNYAYTLRIEGSDLTPTEVSETVQQIRPDANGNFNLSPDDADLHGNSIKAEEHGDQSNIGFWDNGSEWVSWKVQFPKTGVFKLSTQCATLSPSSDFVVEIGGQQLSGKAQQTGSWDSFTPVDLGQVEIKNPGQQTISVKPRDPNNWHAINLRAIKLEKVD